MDETSSCYIQTQSYYAHSVQDELAEYPQMLIIAKNHRHARSLYDQTKHLEGAFYLITLMCAKHRSQKLYEIRGRLKNGEPCRVIATSLIEASVDVDFPLVMCAEAGLDSVAQAAGRCNREGKRPSENSFVWIFTPEEQWKAPPELAIQAAVIRLTADSFSDDLIPQIFDFSTPQAIYMAYRLNFAHFKFGESM